MDLWGRIRTAAEAERLRALAGVSAYRTAALTLSAEIARTWYRLAEAREQVELLERQLETNESMLGLMETRFGTGLVRAVDVLRQRGLAEGSRERLSLARGRLAVLEHQLAVLLGRPPQEEVSSDSVELPELPPLPDAGLPAELVRRRPDVRGAFALLEAADRDLATAISEQYPRLDLSLSASTASGGADELFRDWALSFAGEFFAPIFLGGELRAEVDRAEAERRRRLKEYGQAILESFLEVEDALVLEARRTEALRSLERQVELGRQAQERLQIEFVHGTSDYLDALIALDELQELGRDLLAARLSVVEARIALHRALAGPFETPRESRAAAGETP